MAFTGVAVITQIADAIVHVTGVSLGAGATGTIGLHSTTIAQNVTLPAAFKPRQYTFNNVDVSLVTAIDVTVKPTTTGAIVIAVPVHIAKAGATPLLWAASLVNPTAGATQTLEIYVKFHE